MSIVVIALVIVWVFVSFFGAYFLYRRFAFFRSLRGVWAIFGVFLILVLIDEGFSRLAGFCGAFNELLAYPEHFLAGLMAFLFLIQAFALAVKVSKR